MKFIRLLTYFLCCVFWTNSLAASNSKLVYSLKKLEGPALVWVPWASRWTPAKNGDLTPGSLLQMQEGGSAVIEIRHDPPNAGPVTQLTFNSPLIVRVEPSLTRKVRVSSFFISELPGHIKEEQVNKKGNQTFSLSESWQRFTALFNSKEDLGTINRIGKIAKTKSGVEQAIATKSLLLYTPKNATITLANKLPVSVRITWEKAEPNLQYEVRVWGEGQDQNRPLAITSQDEYLAKIENEGPFYIQIASTDGVYQSFVHRIEVAVSSIYGDERKENVFKDAFTKAQKEEEPTFELLLPPDNFSYLRQSEFSLLMFTWNAPEHIFTPHHYEFVVSDQEGKELSRTKLKTKITYMKFSDPGNYYWSVEAFPSPGDRTGDDDGRPFISDHRAIHIISQARMTSLRTPDPFDLVDSILAKGSGVYFMEAGL
jgi:hypothetical protein